MNPHPRNLRLVAVAACVPCVLLLTSALWRPALDPWPLSPGLRPPASAPRVEASSFPTRLISLVPNVTEMLFAISAGDRLVGVSSFDEFPPEVKRITRVGALLDPDLERIFSLKPDLVIVYGSQRELQVQLKRAGIQTYSYRHGGVKDIMRVMRDLGTRLGLGGEADGAARHIEAGLGAIRKRSAGRPRPRVLLVFGHEKGTLRGIYASGGTGFLHDLLEIGGGTNVFSDVPRESVQASTELILGRAPEIVIDIDGGKILTAGAAHRAAEVWSALSSLPAVQHHRVHVLSGQELVTPGPRIVQAAERIEGAIQGTDQKR